MLRDASLMILELAKKAHQYGYDMVDSHAKNVMFKNNKPLYVDLGSFVQRRKGATGFQPYSEFLSCYYYILKMRESGMKKIPTQLKNITFIPRFDYLLYKYPICRHFPKILEKVISINEKLYGLSLQDIGNVSIKNSKRSLLAKWLVNIITSIKPFNGQHLDKIEKKIRKINFPNHLYRGFHNDSALPNGILDSCKGKRCFFINPSTYIQDLKAIAARELLVCDLVDDLGNEHYRQMIGMGLQAQQIVFDVCFPYVRLNTQKPPEERIHPEIIILNDPDDIERQTGKSFLVTLKSLFKWDFEELLIISSVNKPTNYIDKLFLVHKKIIDKEKQITILKKKL